MQGAQNKRPSMKKEATLKRKGLKTKGLRWKNRQPQNARGSKQKTSDENEASILSQLEKEEPLPH
jgi:hypothetical protein